MLQRMLASAVAAALVAGVVAAVLQHGVTTPIIIEAEAYEQAGTAAQLDGPAPMLVRLDQAAGHDHGEAGWTPSDGLERTFFTSLTSIVVAFGWALVLVALMVLRGERESFRRGLIWGACCFAATALAPSLGLPPELPGAMAAEVGARQAWWVMALVSSGAGIWLLAFAGVAWRLPVGLVLLVLPHVIGAPHPEHLGGTAPPELAAHFAAASLAVAAVFWLVLGGTAGAVLARLDAANPAGA